MVQITTEVVNTFLNGRDPMEHIIAIECGYQDDRVSIIYVNDKGEKRMKLDDFKPFVWAKNSVLERLFDGDRNKIISAMRRYGIWLRKLATTNDGSETSNERLLNGYKYMFYATRKMPYSTFLNFFKEGGTPIHSNKKTDDIDSSREFMSVTPVEQYMIYSGRRLFKGYDNYDELNRFVFDLETQGLNPKRHRIEQIGVRSNKGFEKVITVDGADEKELDRNELKAIDEFLEILSIIKPDTIVGHNSENFDWDFLIVRCEMLGADFSEMSLKYFSHPIYKMTKEKVLKLGGEMEYYKPTIMWGYNILDSLHAARRAQAIDSNMKSSNLKYVTKYLNLKKDNRVYVPGDKITSTWNVKGEVFALSEINGDWYRVTTSRPLVEGYHLVSGRYIVERYLLDDLWETDKVEDKLNESNFLVGKMLPTTFSRACTMGTAGIWKLIMLAWCYENELAVPSFSENVRFTGGLSRLLVTGFVDRIVKLDYNSLYPSVILTWNIGTPIDVTNVMLSFLEYILTQREKYKELKADAGVKIDELNERLKAVESESDKSKIKDEIKRWKGEKSGNDKKQLPLKILANSFFGGYGSPNVFPFGDVIAAEKTTCISRMLLRLMIYHFTQIGYRPIVGDSFTGDTPLFIKYDDTDYIDIKPIEELIGNTEMDALGREYDTSEKPFKVLCRSGWMKPSYIYRHKTNKPLYEVSEGNMSVTVTEDHSLFTNEQVKIKPSEITKDTKLEYFKDNSAFDRHFWVGISKKRVKTQVNMLKNGTIDRIPMTILNGDEETVKNFIELLGDWDYSHTSKTCRAGIMYLKNGLNNRWF